MIDVKAQASNETDVQTIGLSVIGQSRSFAPPVTSFQMQQIARPVPGRGQVAPATFRRAGKSDSSTIPAGHREEVNAPAPSPAVSPGVVAGQSRNAATNSLAADRSSAAEGGAQDIVPTVSTGWSSVGAEQSVSAAGNAMANDRPPAGSEPVPAVSEIAPPALVRQSGEAESAIIQSQGLGDLATANDGQSLRPDRTATSGSGSTSDSSETPAPRADIRPREQQPESMPKVGTSHMIDVKAQASNETNVQTIGLSVIGQSRSFAPPVTSFQMQQIARPIIAACQTETSDDAAEGTGTSLPASALVKTLEIRLDPESLGVVMVKMRLSGDALEIQVEADHQETLSLLRDNKDVLSQSLQSSGYKLDAMTLQASAGEAGSDAGQASPGQGHHFEFQSSAQGSFLGSSQQGEYRSRDQSRLEKGSEGTSGETLGSRAQETGPDRRSGAIYV